MADPRGLMVAAMKDPTGLISGIWEFPQIEGYLLGPHNKDCSLLGLYWGHPNLGKVTYVP